jgi:hypothetical protein
MPQNNRRKWVTYASWSVLAGLILLAGYPLTYLLSRTVSFHGTDGITFQYPSGSRWYATSVQSAKELLVIRQLHAAPSSSDGNIYVYSETWQYVTGKDNPSGLWRVFGPLERLELRWHGRNEVVLSDREFAEYTGDERPANERM